MEKEVKLYPYSEEENTIERLKNKLSSVFCLISVLGCGKKVPNKKILLKNNQQDIEDIKLLMNDLELDLERIC